MSCTKTCKRRVVLGVERSLESRHETVGIVGLLDHARVALDIGSGTIGGVVLEAGRATHALGHEDLGDDVEGYGVHAELLVVVVAAPMRLRPIPALGEGRCGKAVHRASPSVKPPIPTTVLVVTPEEGGCTPGLPVGLA
ncbi:hypothetical protein CYMTET_31531 [Cymbomonas tetramitiformis]|uniref:Uncharacterized protein n=1 Tax=Cymbomonas tetramitiformis TaxID=36881 RepID=A0AAE0KST4_9CHLO|nr:hypothetical protein CYMTET_31531 [Cymbomonas tetramitiformis]